MAKAAIVPTEAPWGSKERVNRAGEAIRAGKISNEDGLVLEIWRASHNIVLNTFQATLRRRTRGTEIAVAQRLKRRVTIIDKLHRQEGMQLARMDDLAGCRLIFPNVKDLVEFRASFHKANFRHKMKNAVDKYDYIKSPKASGYRGVHDIYSYDTKSLKGKIFKGLLLELQYRTECQHAWATSVELLTRFTGEEPKFDRGANRTLEFFKLASEVIARTKEGLVSCYAQLPDAEVADRLLAIDDETRIMRLFRETAADPESSKAQQLILHQKRNGDLQIHSFPTMQETLEQYFRLEKEFPADDIVLVRGNTFAEIRTAYRNYFSDVGAFVQYVDEGCAALRSGQ